MLKRAGINTSPDKAHSYRSVATSKTKVLGTSLKDILERGKWSEASTWQKNYNEEIGNTRESSEFETVILTNALN